MTSSHVCPKIYENPVCLESVHSFIADPNTVETEIKSRELARIIGEFLDTLTLENRVIFMLLNGEYITTVPSEYLHDTGISEEMIAKEELVYRTENVNEIFMPYYRYYIELKESGLEMADGLKLYGVYYVPAVSAEYLVDFPIWDGSFN